MTRLPFLLAVFGTTVVFALGSTALDVGAAGVAAGAAAGFVWSVVLARIVGRLSGRPAWTRPLANASIFAAIVCSGVMLGGGIMYFLLLRAASDAPRPVLTTMMQVTVPFFIALNTPLEVLLVPAAVVANWQFHRRRVLVTVAALTFYAVRVWSYLGYVPGRLEIASRPLSETDVEWFQQSLSVDWRPVLVAIVFLAFTAAAFIGLPGAARRPRIGVENAPDQERREEGNRYTA